MYATPVPAQVPRGGESVEAAVAGDLQRPVGVAGQAMAQKLGRHFESAPAVVANLGRLLGASFPQPPIDRLPLAFVNAEDVGCQVGLG